jgi:hypothetical protein
VKSQTDKPNDKIAEKLGGISGELTARLTAADEKIAQFDKQYEKLTIFYTEDGKKVASDEFFGKIDAIWNSYRKVNYYSNALE